MSDEIDTRTHADAEARRRRIECRHRAGRMLDSVPELKWLYFDLILKGVSHWRIIESDLEEFVREPIWGSLWGRDDALIEQAARYVDRPLFHCTGLRDFFIVRLAESLSRGVDDDPRRRKPNTKLWLGIVASALAMTALLWTYLNWWSAALMLFCAFMAGRHWEREYESSGGMYSRRFYQNYHTREALQYLVKKLTRGGFDEPTIISELELIDARTSPGSVRLLNASGNPFLLENDTPFAGA